jgi:hypothetical protein
MARTADEWAEQTKLGWAMMLDVLDALLPTETSTCRTAASRDARARGYEFEAGRRHRKSPAALVPVKSN